MASSFKIVLIETTNMTLHERFSIYQQTNQTGINPANSMHALLMNQQGSAKNRRLAVQMASRPSVVSALRLKKQSLQQCLGQNQGYFNQRFNTNASHLSLGFKQRFNGNNGRFWNFGGNMFKLGTSPLLKARLGPYQNAAMFFSGYRGSFPQSKIRNNFRKGKYRNTINHQLTQQSLSINGGILFSNRINKSSFRARQQRGRGMGRGGKNRRGRGMEVPSKQDLDNDLDEYMTQVKI